MVKMIYYTLRFHQPFSGLLLRTLFYSVLDHDTIMRMPPLFLSLTTIDAAFKKSQELIVDA